jgi:hypothetical protein
MITAYPALRNMQRQIGVGAVLGTILGLAYHFTITTRQEKQIIHFYERPAPAK